MANAADIKTVEIGTNGGAANLIHCDEMRQKLAVANSLKGRLGFVSPSDRVWKDQTASGSPNSADRLLVIMSSPALPIPL